MLENILPNGNRNHFRSKKLPELNFIARRIFHMEILQFYNLNRFVFIAEHIFELVVNYASIHSSSTSNASEHGALYVSWR